MERVVETHSSSWGIIEWSAWVDLLPGGRKLSESICKLPGFYRIRSPSYPGLVYVGQTGRNLRQRVQDLARGIMRDRSDPPWNDPHTAAPILWAYRTEDNFTFEVSVAAAELSKSDRECYEDYLLYQHRLHHGYSTLINHGRLHPLWTRASNRAKGRSTKRRDMPEVFDSLKPAIGNEDVLADDWLELDWSSFKSLSDTNAPNEPGVYRIVKGDEIVYIGQSGKLSSRIATHKSTATFSTAVISFSVMPGAAPHQLKERETDLIGAYYGREGRIPPMQYGGR
jgi:hypothetical protein